MRLESLPFLGRACALGVVVAQLFVACAAERLGGGERGAPSALSQDRSGDLPYAVTSPYGLLRGRFAVDRNGAATYRLPLQLPPGRAGLEPELALTYSSSRGQGALGMGFAIDGPSQIQRCGSTFAEDGKAREIVYFNTDHFCWKGQRLMEVQQTRYDYGIVKEYRTRLDKNARIVAFGPPNISHLGWEPEHFEVETVDGRRHSFGAADGSRRYWRDQRRATFAWLLDKTSDRFGNAIEYRYHKHRPPDRDPIDDEDVEVLLERVRYTLHEPSSLDAAHEVRFLYRSDPNLPFLGYRSGMLSTVTRLVRRIEVYTDGVLNHQYAFSYRRSAATGRTLLASLEACAGTAGCLEPVSFAYQEPVFQIPAGIDVSPITKEHRESFRLMDVNGDGRADLLRHYVKRDPSGDYRTVDIALSRYVAGQGGYPFAPFTATGLVLPYVANDVTGALPLDFNRDGKMDLMFYLRSPGGGSSSSHPNWRFLESTGTTFVPHVLFASAGGAWGDYDGDGLVDLALCVPGSNDDDRIGIALNVDGINVESTYRLSPVVGRACTDGHNGPVDLEGDGATDTLVNDALHLGVVGLVDGQVTATTYSRLPGGLGRSGCPGGGSPGAGLHCPLLMDFNGDGLRDILVRNYRVAGENSIYFGTGRNLHGVRGGPGDQDGGFLFAKGTFADPYFERARAADFNLDGKDDLLSITNSEVLKVLLSSGVNSSAKSINWLERPALFLPKPGNPPEFTFGDVDGNGAADILVHTEGRHTLYVFGQSRPDLLTAVRETSQADTVRVHYEPLSNPTVYDNTSCTAAYPTKCAPGNGHHVVDAVHYDAGPAQPERTLRYNYDNAKTNIAGLGWVGFERVTQTDESTGAITVTEWDLRYQPSIKAYPYRDLFQRQVTTTQVADQDHPIDGVTHSLTINRTLATEARPDGTYFPYVSDEHTLEHEGSQRTTDFRRVVENMNRYGFPTVLREERPGETVRIARRVSADEQLWFLGRPEYESITSSPAGRQARTRHRGWSWDAHHAVPDFFSARYGAKGDDPLRSTTDLDYDAYGNVISVEVRDTRGNARRYSADYQDAHHAYPTDLRNPLGHTTTQRFDVRHGRLRWQRNHAGVITRSSYDAWGHELVNEHGDGTRTLRTLSAPLDQDFGYFRLDIDAPGTPTRTLEFDRLGRAVRSIWAGFDGTDLELRAFFDRHGNLRETWEPAPLGSPPPSHERRSWQHDVLGRVVAASLLGGGYEVYDYDPGASAGTQVASGTVVETFNARGHQRLETRDPLGRVVRERDALGHETHYRYGAFSLLEEIEDSKGHKTSIQYDDYGWRTALDEPNAGLTQLKYTPFGEVAALIDARGDATVFSYDALGRRQMRSDPDGRVARWEYDGGQYGTGLLNAAVSADGQRVWYQFDAAQRVIGENHVIDGTRLEHSYSYDAHGRLETHGYPKARDGSHLVVRQLYRNGFLSAVVENGSQEAFWVRLAADAAGRTTSELYGNGVRTESTYSPWGALESTRSHGGHGRASSADFRSVRYTYDQNHNLIGRTDLVNGWREVFSFDPLDRLTMACTEGTTDPIAAVPRADGRPNAAMGFSPFRRSWPRGTVNVDPATDVGTRLGQALPLGNGNPTENRLLRAIGMPQSSVNVWEAPGFAPNTPQCVTAQYDALGNITSRSDVGRYDYDRRLSETVDLGYGPTQRTRVFPHAIGTLERNDGTRSHYSYDRLGRLISNGVEEITWTATNKVRTIVDPTAGRGVSFEYGPFGERSKKNTASEATLYAGTFQQRSAARSGGAALFLSATVETDHHFIVADGRVVAEVARHVGDLSGVEPGFNGASGLGADATDLADTATGMSGGSLRGRYTLYFFHADHLGSVEHITGSTGLTAEVRSYDAWGRLRRPPHQPVTVTSALWPTRRDPGFSGHEDDEEFGVVNMQGRIYDPRIGRMFSPDPLVAAPFVGQALNRYAYVLNNPVSLVDPSGYSPAEPGEGGGRPGGAKLGSDASSTAGSLADPNSYEPLVVTADPSETPTGGESAAPPVSTGMGDAQGTRGAVSVDPMTLAARQADLELWKRALSLGARLGAFAYATATYPLFGVVTAMAAGGKNSDDFDILFILGVRAARNSLPARAGSEAAQEGLRALVEPAKWDYFFGHVTSGRAHNIARSAQNAAQLRRIGIHDNVSGRQILQSHFDDVVRDSSSIAETFSNQYGSFEVRESLLAGPGGFLRLESTWQIMDDGTRRITTLIPMGGP